MCTDLPVPDAAVRALLDPHVLAEGDAVWRGLKGLGPDLEACVAAVAAPVVAAVLRALVEQADHDRGQGGPDYADGFFDGVNTVRDRAEKLADELDAQATG